MGKGEQTKLVILTQALDIASEVGLEGLTIGHLAKQVQMSKSGLYAHFDSREALQMAVLDQGARGFIDRVLTPALKQPRGIPRLDAIFRGWIRWPDELSGGCLFIAAVTELDDRPGPVRDHLIGHLHDLLGAIGRAAQIAIDEGQFRADVDVEQFAYEVWANLVSHHHHARLLGPDTALDRAQRMFASLVERSTC